MSPTPNPTTPVRRTAALALAALTLLAALGLIAEPAAAYAPNAPRPVVVAGYAGFTRVYFAPPADTGGKPISSYKIERWGTAPDDLAAQKSWVRANSAPLLDTTTVVGGSYKDRYQSTTADGTSNWSAFTNVVVPNRTELFKFGNDAAEFVDRQYQDLLGRAPTAFEAATDVQALENGTKKTGQIIDKLVLQSNRVGLRHPVIRLYFAYFDRAPDHGGLDHWVAKRKTGTNLDVVSANFAGSSEFKNTYGNLNDTQFIDLVYDNVLGRNPDAAGADYWEAQLDNGTSRGRMMTQFSESGEYKSKSRGLVLASDVYDDMLDVANSGSELTLWAAHIQGGGNAGDYGTRIMLLGNYTFAG